MKFFEGGTVRLATSVLTKDNPAYVQFYVTARCDLACRQCNVIYANADQEEVNSDQCARIAENLGKIGVSVVLLTGGEPFVHRDLATIAKRMIENSVHPRYQTNGFASRKRLEEMVAVGAVDISVSLDTLTPSTQDWINGDSPGSWERAIRTIATVNELFPSHSFTAIGCVLTPENFRQVPGLIEFATEIGWWVSLVPAHTTPVTEPRSFSSFDTSLKFSEAQYQPLSDMLERIKQQRNAGSLLYDSDEYLDDIYRYVTGQPIRWRRRNQGVCDAPGLYFAIQPNGNMSVCCDYRLPKDFPVYDPDFPRLYRSQSLRSMARKITTNCSGCMYGSFPEITVTSRYFKPMMARAKLFLGGNLNRPKKRLNAEQMMELASEIAHQNRMGDPL